MRRQTPGPNFGWGFVAYGQEESRNKVDRRHGATGHSGWLEGSFESARETPHILPLGSSPEDGQEPLLLGPLPPHKRIRWSPADRSRHELRLPTFEESCAKKLSIAWMGGLDGPAKQGCGAPLRRWRLPRPGRGNPVAPGSP